MTEPLLSLTELAQQLGRPRMWIWRLVKAQQIPFSKIGRSYYFRRSEVEAWIARHTVAPKTATAVSRAAVRRDLEAELEEFGLSRDDFESVN